MTNQSGCVPGDAGAPVLLIGRRGSRGVPGKNTMPILGRPLMTYPILAARASDTVGEIYVSTDDPAIVEIAVRWGCTTIERPASLAGDCALVEDVVVHGYEEIVRLRGERPPIFVLLFCNTATISKGIIDAGVRALQDDESLDSAVSVSPYNEFSPVRAKRVDEDGLLVSYVEVDSIAGASCDRDSADTAYFCDCSVWVLRDRCIDLDRGLLPFRWMGRRTLPLYQHGGLDIDHGYGIAMTEHWLLSNGFTAKTTPYDDATGQPGAARR